MYIDSLEIKHILNIIETLPINTEVVICLYNSF
jgi:hypothetical protein